MTIKVVKTIKQLVLFSVLFAGIVSCESDIENLGTNIVENGIFDSNVYNSDVKTYNQNILSRRAKGLGQYLLGVYHTDDFGKLEASIATQLAPSGIIDFGTDPVMDAVILTIPYQVGENTADVGEAPAYELDSIFGDPTKDFNLNIYELTSYLNTLDPLNPSETLKYYTNQSYSYGASLYSGTFKPDANDTILIVDRPEVIIDYDTMEFDRDTIKRDNAEPAIRLPLNESFFTNNFLLNASFPETTEGFVEFFNGLYIEATQAGDPKASIMSLNLLAESNITIYYTNTVVKDETIEGVDLNGDTVIEATANVKTKQTAVFSFSGITTNTYTRDYTSATADTFINSPNVTSGDEKLFLQGAAGSYALIDLFTNDDINALRNNNWLINEASLTFYIDQSAENLNIPEKLFVYNYDDNAQMLDMFTEGPEEFDGTLQNDDNNNPLKYTVNITNYVSNILKSTDPITPSKLAVKVYNPTDLPVNVADIEIKDYSWTPKGVVVHGNQSADIEKRIKLEITYTKLN